MRNLVVLLFLLAACAAATKTPAQTVYTMRGTYDTAFLVPASQYNTLPRCGVTPATAANPCSDPKAVDALRKADASAKSLLDTAEDIARNNPSLDSSLAIAAAQDAVNAALKIIAVYAPPKTGVK